MRNRNHAISQLQVHIVWVTKYRYKVLKGKIQERCRKLLIQVCDAEDIRILSGVVSKDKDHVHIHIEYESSKSVSHIREFICVIHRDHFNLSISKSNL